MQDFYSDFPKRIEHFHKYEPRAFCYDLAMNLVNQAKNNDSENWYIHSKTIEGIILLLFCWNFAAIKTKELTKTKVENLLRANKDKLKALEKYDIMDFSSSLYNNISKVFKTFKNIFGQTGASKALSLLNPKLFVMWDTKIRKGLNKKKIMSRIGNGEKAEHYLKFLEQIKRIIETEKLLERNIKREEIAKKIDEFHYAKIVL